MSSGTALDPKQAVAVIGGAVAGAQVTRLLADRGVMVAVFEQNARPFGKIEDGLPRWHSALRNKEFKRIQERLDHPNIHFLPMTKVGRDVGFRELVDDWGFSAVVLANGAWRDRPLPIPDADKYVNKGLIYQNPFIVAFNHAEDPGYTGPKFPILDGAIVVGGGLASIDVVKVLMLETGRAALAARGHDIDAETLEKAGLPKTCESLGLRYEDLGLTGATLVYRRRAEDMPLAAIPDGATEEKAQKVMANRRKILERAQSKFCFRFEELAVPEEGIIENDRLVGLKLRRMQPGEGRRLVRTDEVKELRASYVISSIGSIPDPIPGIDMKGELFAFTDWDLGRLDGLPTVFSAGNVVTGKGNIVSSRRHSQGIGEHLIRSYLGLDDGPIEGALDNLSKQAAQAGGAVAEAISNMEPLDEATMAKLKERIAAHQRSIGYEGLAAWLERHPAAA
ncbi:MAG: hypothetical protein AAFN74_11320 [Myxococcota bacterium]